MSLSKEPELEEVVRESFSYLTDEYGLTYRQTSERNFEFSSSKIRIELSVGRKSPEIYIYKVGEPDFTRLVLPRVIQYFKRRVNIDHLFRYFPDYPLDDNIRFAANLFEKYTKKIVYQIDEWWIPAQAFQYKLIEKEYRDANQLDDFLFGFKDLHDYLYGKGSI